MRQALRFAACKKYLGCSELLLRLSKMSCQGAVCGDSGDREK